MTTTAEPRQPCAFDPGDPNLVAEGEPETEAGVGERALPAEAAAAAVTRPTLAGLGRRGLRWGAVLVSALAGAAALSAGASFARLVSVALMRKDWVRSKLERAQSCWALYGFMMSCGAVGPPSAPWPAEPLSSAFEYVYEICVCQR